jgi:hypothetical protein
MSAPAITTPRREAIEPRRARRLRIAAAVLSLDAAVIHALAAPQHVAEWWGYGSFFLTAAAAQGLFGLLLLGQPWRYDADGVYDPHRSEALVRRLLQTAAALTAAVVVLYVVTRTFGIPLLGPAAGEVEPVDGAGLAAVVVELVQIACLLALVEAGRER